MDTHTHKWRKVYEQSLIGGAFSVGWECIDCKKFVGNGELTPEGLGGVVTKGMRLYGVHGGAVQKSDDTWCKEQIVDEDGNLHIIPLEEES